MEELNLNDSKLKILRNLVNINDQDLKTIFTNLNKNKNVQLLDYIHYLGLSENFIKEILNNLSHQTPKEREEFFKKYTKVILSLRTVEHNLSILRLNPLTKFENNPPLFFGMGGGSYDRKNRHGYRNHFQGN